jgi:hypothetical protein
MLEVRDQIEEAAGTGETHFYINSVENPNLSQGIPPQGKKNV